MWLTDNLKNQQHTGSLSILLFFSLGAGTKAVRYTVNCPFKSPLRVIGPTSGYKLSRLWPPPPPVIGPSPCKQKKKNPDILPYNFSKYIEMNWIYYDDSSLNWKPVTRLLGAGTKAVRYTVNCPFKSPLRVIGPTSGYKLSRLWPPPPPVIGPSPCKQKNPPDILPYNFSKYIEMNSIYYDDLSLNWKTVNAKRILMISTTVV